MKLPTLPAAEYGRLLRKDRVMAILPQIVPHWERHVRELLGLNHHQMSAFLKRPPNDYEDLLIGVIERTRDDEMAAARRRAAERDDLIKEIRESRQQLEWSTDEPSGGEQATARDLLLAAAEGHDSP